MNFLPDNYIEPKSSNTNYFKMQDGENRIRILSKPIVGWEDWTSDRKVFRFKMEDQPEKPLVDGNPIKIFWAMIVWNVKLGKIQIFQPTQKTIHGRIKELCNDEEWGVPINYDIKISKSGTDKLTKYIVNPCSKTPVSQDILKTFKETPIQLEALFINADPFKLDYKYYTPLMSEAVEKTDVKPLYMDDKISLDQDLELNHLLYDCSDEAQKGFKDYIVNAYKIEKLEELPQKEYQKIKDMLIARSTQHQAALLEAEMKDTPEARKKGEKK